MPVTAIKRKKPQVTKYLLFVFSVFSFLWGVTDLACAGTSDFTIKNLRIINAADFVVGQAGPYAMKQELLLGLQNNETARDFAERGFEVRIFRIEENGYPKEQASLDPCAVYLSTVFSSIVVSHDKINLGQLKSPYWLTPTNAVMTAGHFLLIFEENTNRDHLFRLITQDKEKYFSYGLSIVVEPDDNYDSKIVKLYDPAEARANATKVPCYRGAWLQASTTPQRIVELQTCGELSSPSAAESLLFSMPEGSVGVSSDGVTSRPRFVERMP